jgi:hypothetical protein
MFDSILLPVIALILWTFVIWVWMYATRIPALRAARIDVRGIKRKSDIDALPVAVQQIADNYNHLHEQPTVFYVLALCAHVLGAADGGNVLLAWSYVALRVVHSIIQCTRNFVPVRFFVFAASSIVLMVMTLRLLIALLVAPHA